MMLSRYSSAWRKPDLSFRICSDIRSIFYQQLPQSNGGTDVSCMLKPVMVQGSSPESRMQIEGRRPSTQLGILELDASDVREVRGTPSAVDFWHRVP